MYLNRWVLSLSLIAGVVGIWSVQRAFSEYRQAAASFASISASYVPDTSVWLDSEFSSGQEAFVVINDTAESMTIEFVQTQAMENYVINQLVVLPLLTALPGGIGAISGQLPRRLLGHSQETITSADRMD